MPKDKIVPIDQAKSDKAEKPRYVAGDTASRRFILGIGQKRIAFDFSTRVTELAPGTGDAPAPVLPLKKESKGRKKKE